MKFKLDSRVSEEMSTTSDMQVVSLLIAESEEELKSLLMKVKEKSERAGLKLILQETKIKASSSIISWEIEGRKLEARSSDRFYFLGLQNHCGQ